MRKKVDFMDEIEPINLTNRLHEKSLETYEFNNGLYEFTFKSADKLVNKINEFFDELSFVKENYITRYFGGGYWCGCLTLIPFDEVDEGEPYMLDCMLHDHTEVVINDDGELIMRFKLCDGSILNDLFLKYSDGCGGNIPYSYASMIKFALKAFDKWVDKDIEKRYRHDLGEWFSYLEESYE